ncbi:hypothetical protein GQ53DRAFT_764944 [Thozetella sp. PMI_491]|nr:hypothetical protein GQ53DRAFT_764944 [Thozetella sp. PMI_491]
MSSHHVLISSRTSHESRKMSSLFGSLKKKMKRTPSNKSNEGGLPNEAPPPYTVAAREAVAELAASAPQRLSAPMRSAVSVASTSRSRREAVESLTREDRAGFLRTFDTIFLIDDSGSMAGSSWREVQALLEKIAPICTEYDEDGIDVYFLNHKNPEHPTGGYINIRAPDDVQDIFRKTRPHAGTPTGRRIRQVLKPYLRQYKAEIAAGADPDETNLKPINMIIITDGEATDDPETDITDIARDLDDLRAPGYQIGLQFFQIGTVPEATEFLRHLDDSISGNKNVRDMVDTVTWDGKEGGRPRMDADTVLKTVLGAVCAKFDRMQQPSRIAAGH